MTQKQIAKQLGWNVDRVKYYFNKLKTNGFIKRVGSSQTGYWELLLEELEELEEENIWIVKQVAK
jgi:predicted HTH transcriptional regulator